MMRYVFLLLLMFSINQYGLSQENDSLDIYSESLYWHLQNLKAVNALNEQTIYVEQDATSTVGLPEEIDNIKIVLLSREEIRAKTKNGVGISLIVIKPVKVELTTLKVVLIDFHVTSKKRNFNYANGGGSTIEFKYNCDTEKFEYWDKKYHGL